MAKAVEQCAGINAKSYNLENVLIATAENEEITGHHWHVITTSNNQTAHLNSSIGKDSYDIVKYLVDNLYL